MSKISKALRICILPVMITSFINCNFGSQEKHYRLYTIEIKQMQFQPAVLKVHSGDTVVWVNHDIVAHDVTEQSRKAWSSSPLAPGASWHMIANENADYYCSIHQVMKGKLEVDKQ